MIVMASTSAYTVGIVIVVVIALLIVVSCIKIVPQASAVILERLGAYKATWSVGIHLRHLSLIKLPEK